MGEKQGPEPPEDEHWTSMPGGEQRLTPLMGNADPEMMQHVMKAPEALVMPEIPHPVPRYSQREVQAYRHERFGDADDDTEYYCAPTAFFALADASGYARYTFGNRYGGQVDPVHALAFFVETINEEAARDPAHGWKRGPLSREMRRIFSGMPVISWHTGKYDDVSEVEQDDRSGMHWSGYVQTPEEYKFFRENILHRDISEIVNSGYPVMVTVEAGFAKNQEAHSIIIDGWGPNGVHIMDPDPRNKTDLYSPDYIRRFLTGACSVIPPVSQAWIDEYFDQRGRYHVP